MKIFIGADHNGYDLRNKLIAWLKQRGYTVIDEGDQQRRPDDDYPQFASRTVTALLAKGSTDDKAILICGSGQGMCIAANRFIGIRACLCWDVTEARMSRNDDDANVLCLPARLVGTTLAENIVHTWLDTPFAGASRFRRRIKQLDELG